jgi:hypothetical protein
VGKAGKDDEALMTKESTNGDIRTGSSVAIHIGGMGRANHGRESP